MEKHHTFFSWTFRGKPANITGLSSFSPWHRQFVGIRHFQTDPYGWICWLYVGYILVDILRSLHCQKCWACCCLSYESRNQSTESGGGLPPQSKCITWVCLKMGQTAKLQVWNPYWGFHGVLIVVIFTSQQSWVFHGVMIVICHDSSGVNMWVDRILVRNWGWVIINHWGYQPNILSMIVKPWKL